MTIIRNWLEGSGPSQGWDDPRVTWPISKSSMSWISTRKVFFFNPMCILHIYQIKPTTLRCWTPPAMTREFRSQFFFLEKKNKKHEQSDSESDSCVLHGTGQFKWDQVNLNGIGSISLGQVNFNKCLENIEEKCLGCGGWSTVSEAPWQVSFFL